MSAMASQITNISTVYSGVKETPKLSATGLCEGINRWSMDSPHKGPAMRKNVSIWWRHAEILVLWCVLSWFAIDNFNHTFQGYCISIWSIIHINWKVVRGTAPVFTGDVEDKLQRLQWISELSTWRPLRLCVQLHVQVPVKHPDDYGSANHDDVVKWKHFPRYWPFVRRIHRSPVNSPHKGQWRGALMFSLDCTWMDDWVNNRESGDLRRHRAYYDVTVMITDHMTTTRQNHMHICSNMLSLICEHRSYGWTRSY